VTAAAGPCAVQHDSAAQQHSGSRTAVLSLGSNLGDKVANLQQGLLALCRDGLRCRAVSAVYQTDPVGGPDQDDYLNVVLLADSRLPAREILARCMAAEKAAGRVRAVRWGPRTLDVDIISYGDEVSADPELTLPHPRAHERAFVLVPWLDVAPDAVLPGHGPVARLPAAAEVASVRKLAGVELTLPGHRAVAGRVAPDDAGGEVTGCG
jgi:2-amino-4-hydroxy-6-hydroxymethyldihydropteridine diphosphokinase